MSSGDLRKPSTGHRLPSEDFGLALPWVPEACLALSSLSYYMREISQQRAASEPLVPRAG